jgi:UrcA family protein
MSIFELIAIASAVTMVPAAPDQPRQAHVNYQDLNLATTSGQQRLDRRLHIAMDRVCGSRWTNNLNEQREYRKCRNRALAEIAPQRQAAILKASGVRVAGRNF